MPDLAEHFRRHVAACCHLAGVPCPPLDDGRARLSLLESVEIMEGWVTLSNKDAEGDRHGSTHVYIGPGGKITKGPEGMRGKKPGELSATHKVTAVHGEKHPGTGWAKKPAARGPTPIGADHPLLAPSAPAGPPEAEAPRKGGRPGGARAITKPEESRTFNDWVGGGGGVKELVAGGRDLFMAALNKELGLDAKPKVVGEAEMDRLVAAGGWELFRGVTDPKFADDFRGGDFFAGLGMYGNGTYTANVRDGAEGAAANRARAYATALRYTAKGGQKKPDAVLRMALSGDARVATAEEAEKMQGEHQQMIEGAVAAARAMPEGPERSRAERRVKALSDFGRYMAMRGYDAMDVGHVVVFNRGACVVQQTPASPVGGAGR